MSREECIEIAQDLIDFCEGLLTTGIAEKFWQAREYNITLEDRLKVFLVAAQLLK